MIAEPSDLEYSENRHGPSTEPRETPVQSKHGLHKEAFHVT